MSSTQNIYKDYYRILGVEKNSSTEDIKKAFRILARKYHPDITKNDKKLEEKFKDIFEAYEVLSDPDKRKTYDEINKKGVTAKLDENSLKKKNNNGSFSDFFYSMFGSVKDNTLKNIKKINHIEKTITISLEEAFNGVQKQISLPIEENCKSCEGTGIVNHKSCPSCKGKGVISDNKNITIKIPSGVSQGSRLSIKGEGHGSGVLKGDLLINISLEKHNFFEIDENNDITCEIPITVTEAILGTEIEVPTLKNSVRMKVPSGTQNGQAFRLKGRGLYNKSKDTMADQYVKIDIIIPKNLTEKETQLYRELSLIERLNPRENLYR
ncbi:MAG: DnaJ C-terminal domain-containing protein [Candidatus Sericytochromatia bacterium]